jgi:hypothetical protein
MLISNQRENSGTFLVQLGMLDIRLQGIDKSYTNLVSVSLSPSLPLHPPSTLEKCRADYLDLRERQ